MLQSQIHKQVSIESLGVFTAYEDGRIRVQFADRTLLAMDPETHQVRVLDKFGQENLVRLDHAIGYETSVFIYIHTRRYVHYAKQFQDWTLGKVREAPRDPIKDVIERSVQFVKSLDF